MKIVKTLSIIALGSIVVSCGSASADEVKETVDSTAVVKDTTPVTVNEETKFKFDFAIANIPSPVVSINELSGWGVEYNNALLVDTKKQLASNAEFSKALALGVYNIDMSYAM